MGTITILAPTFKTPAYKYRKKGFQVQKKAKLKLCSCCGLRPVPPKNYFLCFHCFKNDDNSHVFDYHERPRLNPKARGDE